MAKPAKRTDKRWTPRRVGKKVKESSPTEFLVFKIFKNNLFIYSFTLSNFNVSFCESTNSTFKAPSPADFRETLK